MTKARLILGLCVALGLAALPSLAAADPFSGPPICSSAGTALSGHYRNLTITANAYVASGTTLDVRHELTIAPGACLDAFTLGTVHVRGDVRVRWGATLALGCTPQSLGPPIPQPPCGASTTDDTVGGSIIARHAYTMYLDGDTIGGNVISLGGGPGPTLTPYINFPIKDNTIGGNVLVRGWQGAWFGFIRNTVTRSVVLLDNVGVTLGESNLPDSTEVVSNTIGGDLACFGNSPAAQFGDSGGTPNVVSGQKLGQCSAL